MKAVAMMTPEPKYFATKKAALGTCMDFVRAAKIGKRAPLIMLVDVNGSGEHVNRRGGVYQALIQTQ